MGDPKTRLCETLLEEFFGPLVAKVGSNISLFGTKTLGQICSSSGLSVKDVKRGLSLLLHHNLLSASDTRKPGTPDYSIKKDRVLSLLQYPQYVALVSHKGEEYSEVIYTLCKVGRSTASRLLIQVYKNSTDEEDDANPSVSLHKLEKVLKDLISEELIKRCPHNGSPESDVPELKTDEKLTYTLPTLDIKTLVNGIKEGKEEVDTEDKNIYLTLNLDILNQKVRDSIIEDGAVRRTDKHGGQIVRSILGLSSDLYDPWSQVSGHLGYNQICDKVKKDWPGEDFLLFLDQYLAILSTDRTRFVDKVGDAGGGQYTVNFQHIFQEIASAVVEKIIEEKFGSKSMRIYRYIREKIYVEENQVQQVVMIPSKETKLLTYQLMESNFVCLQELRKNISGNVPSKAIYLFYVNFDQVVRTSIGQCLISVYNLKRRLQQETTDNLRLIEKHDKVEGILQSLKAEGGTDEQLEEVEEMLTPPERESYLSYQSRAEQLSLAQMKSAETLFILQTYLRYKTS